ADGMMLDGILSSGEIERELESLVGAEAAVRRVFRRLHERFMALKGRTLRQRADDGADLGRRVLRHLQGVDGSSLEHVPAGNVLVVERLLPSDVVPLSRRGVAAIVVGALASGAHAALLAREKRIPVVAGPPGIVHRIRNLEALLVDGSRGTIVVSPDAETRRTFQARLEAFDRAPLRGRPVTIRLLDVGGDKPVPFLPLPVEPNPSLGRRGVRLLLEYPQLVRTQLAALFRLAQEQDVRILVPMVTLEEDIREMRV